MQVKKLEKTSYEVKAPGQIIIILDVNDARDLAELIHGAESSNTVTDYLYIKLKEILV